MTALIPRSRQSVIKKRVESIIHSLSKDFSIETLSKSPARFNKKKLEWFNQSYISLLSLDEFIARASWHRINQNYRMAQEYLQRFPSAYIQYEILLCMYHPATQSVVTFNSNNEHAYTGNPLYSHLLIEQGETVDSVISRVVLNHVGVSITPDNGVSVCDIWDIDDRDTCHEGMCHGTRKTVFWYVLSDEEYARMKDSVQKENKGTCYPLSTVTQHGLFSDYWLCTDRLRESGMRESDVAGLITPQVCTYYVAYRLDKQRATTLRDFGTDSRCVLMYEKPESQALLWKEYSFEVCVSTIRTLSDEFLTNLSWWAEALTFIASEFGFEPWEAMHKVSSIDDFQREYDRYLVTLFRQQKLEEWYVKMVAHMETSIKTYLNENQLEYGLYLYPIRIALTGKKKSPSLFEIAPIIGIQGVYDRIHPFLCE